MSTYQDCQNLRNNLSSLNMDMLNESSSLTPANASPPDFDFNLPCRFFKSSFARSLSLTNAGNNQCKSLDYDVRSNNTNNNNNNNSSINVNNQNNNNSNNLNMTSLHKRDAVPPLPLKRSSQAGSLQNQNEANNSNNKQVLEDVDANSNGNDRPPSLPARRPLSLHNSSSNMEHNLSMNELQKNSERKMQAALTQFRQQAFQHALNNSNTSILPVNSNNNNSKTQSQSQRQQLLNQKLINHYSATNGNNNNNNNISIVSNNSNNHSSNFRRNNIVWPNQQNVEQDCNFCDANNDKDINSIYSDTTTTTTRPSITTYQHYHNTHHQQSHIVPTITTTTPSMLESNQQQHQEPQQQQQTTSYEVVNDNTTNVEAVILQNQVDTLQWQLKQVETSCDMYRAVMEEVARFLERYQSQKQLQQQLQQQQQKHSHNNNMEQIPRSKSLYQVYVAGGHEKSTNGGNNILNETISSAATSSSSSSSSYLRARSSTNLIDLKQTAGSTCNKGHRSKDDQHFETGLTPTQSYNAFKDFTWRRSPKKANDARCNTNKDDVEEKLNQEAFRLLRTINNLLNTSQHQPDIAHPRNSLAPGSTLNMGRLSKAMSTTSVMTLPGAPLLNSTSLTTGSTTPDSSTASPCISTANASTITNNLAPEILFMRSANMRDSRLSLRSSTDSSVHSTSSAASSVSSKVETDEEASTPFLSPPNMSSHKQHQHLTGSSTEDESGFSSISSFPDIGVPLNSTMLSSTPSNSSKARTMSKELKNIKANDRVEAQTPPDSRNSTLKANVVGLPLNSSQDMSHRWDSPSKTYHNASTKFQRFSALSNEDSNTVLWV